MSWCEIEMQKYMPLVKQNVMKFEVFILGGQRKEIRDGGEGVERKNKLRRVRCKPYHVPTELNIYPRALQRPINT